MPVESKPDIAVHHGQDHVAEPDRFAHLRELVANLPRPEVMAEQTQHLSDTAGNIIEVAGHIAERK